MDIVVKRYLGSAVLNSQPTHKSLRGIISRLPFSYKEFIFKYNNSYYIIGKQQFEAILTKYDARYAQQLF